MDGINLANMVALFVTMFLLSAVPGPSIVMVVGRSIASGIPHGLVVILGIVLGNVLFVLLAVFGLGAVAQTHAGFFAALKVFGAAYLIWMGIKLLRAKVKSSNVEEVEKTSWGSNLVCGFLITVAAPRAILFYVSTLPAYVDLAEVGVGEIAIILAVATSAVGAAKLVWAFLAHQARAALKSGTAKRRLNIASGLVVLATGAVLIFRA